jgi:hypothetical protein
MCTVLIYNQLISTSVDGRNAVEGGRVIKENDIRKQDMEEKGQELVIPY